MILDDIVRDKRIRLKEHKARISETDMRSKAEEIIKNGAQTHTGDAYIHTDNNGNPVNNKTSDLFYKNMSKPGISIIGEFKMASPSLGDINPKLDLVSRIDEYSASADAQIKDFYQLSRELGLGVLTETHDEYEIERALKTDSRIIGINNRNLKDFTISIENTGRLKKYIPDDRLCIAESGIMNDDDVAYLKEVGVDGFLIGRAFMEAPNPGELSSRWKGI